MLCTGLAVYALYWVVAIIEPHIYRVSFLLVTLVLSFLVYPARRSERRHIGAMDWTLTRSPSYRLQRSRENAADAVLGLEIRGTVRSQSLSLIVIKAKRLAPPR